MARSIWKGPFVEESLLKKLKRKKIIQIENLLKHGQENQQFSRFCWNKFFNL